MKKLVFTIILVLAIIIYWKIPFSFQKKDFLHSMEERIKQLKESQDVCTQEEIEKLPEPLRRYCDFVGVEGTPKYNGVRINFNNTKFIFDVSKGTVLDMDYDLWLFANEWYRSAYCTSSMYGIPFEGQDYCRSDKTGGMKGYLAKAIKIFETNDEESYRAGLISWMIEGVIFNPSFLFSAYIEFEEIDKNHVKGTIEYNGVKGTGIYTISDIGEIVGFYSDERQIEEIDGKKIQIGWRCEAKDYIDVNGIKMPKQIKSIKVFPDKEVLYFDADKYEITYY